MLNSATARRFTGRDFLRANRAVIDLKNSTLQLEPCPTEAYPVRAWSTCVIPPSSEANNRDIPKLLKEIRRVENSVTNKLESLSGQRLYHRRNRPRLQSNQTRNKQEGNYRTYKRGTKPVCYKCGRVGHIQYNCYSYYQPEDYFRTPEHRQDFHPRECKQPRPKSSAHLNALDDQFGPCLQNYHDPHTSNSPDHLRNLLVSKNGLPSQHLRETKTRQGTGTSTSQ